MIPKRRTGRTTRAIERAKELHDWDKDPVCLVSRTQVRRQRLLYEDPHLMNHNVVLWYVGQPKLGHRFSAVIADDWPEYTRAEIRWLQYLRLSLDRDGIMELAK